MLRQIYPMRAVSFDILNATEKEWQDEEYIWEIKEDGERAVLHFMRGWIGMTGRRISDVTGNLPEKHDYVPHITNFDIPDLHGTVIDGELLHPTGDFDLLRSIMGSGTAERAISIQEENGKLEFVAFDLIMFRGRDVTHLPFSVRRWYLEAVVALYRLYYGKHIRTIKQFTPIECDIKELFDNICKNGGEGLMRKKLSGTYKFCPNSMKSNDVQKAKKLLTFDGIVIGYEYGKGKYNKDKIAKLIFGQYRDGLLTKRGTFDGFTKSLIDELTLNPDSFIGRVVEVKCNEVLKSGALRHPKFNRWRDDKPKQECEWESNLR